MSDGKLTLQELSDGLRNGLTQEFDETKKAFEELYKKSGVGDNLDVIRKNLEKQIKPVTDVVNDQKVKEFIKKPESFFKKYLVNPIVGTFEKSILKPISVELNGKVFKPLSELARSGFKQVDRTLSSWFRPLNRTLESALQYLRDIASNSKKIIRGVETTVDVAVTTGKDVGKIANEVLPAVRVFGKIASTLLKVLPLIGLLFDLLSANEIFKAIESQKTQLIELKQQGRDNKASYELLKVLNDKIENLNRATAKNSELLRQFNYTALDIRLSAIEGQLKNLGTGSSGNGKADLSSIESKLGVISSQLDKLPPSGSGKVDLSSVTSQLSSIQSQISKLSATSPKVDLSPLQSQLTSIQGQVNKIPTSASGTSKVDLSAVTSQLSRIESRLSEINSLIQSGSQTTNLNINQRTSAIANELTALKADVKAIQRIDISGILQSLTNINTLLQPLAGIPPTLKTISTKQDKCCLEFHIGNENVLDGLGNLLRELLDLDNDVSVLGSQVNQLPDQIVPKDYTQDLEGLKALLRQIFESLVEVRKTNLRSFNILGGATWFSGDSDTPNMSINPEAKIKEVTATHYVGNDVATFQVGNLLGYVNALQTPSFARAGFHRLPASMPKKIHLKANEVEEVEKIYTLVDYQNWQFRQIDSALGYYPLNIKYKDATGTEKLIEIENLSEAVSEIVGLLLSLDSDTDLISEVAIKNVGETVQNKAQISLAVDYLRAISDFLGFKFETSSKKLQIPIDPRSKSVKGFLEKSEVDIQSIVLKEPDDNDIISKLNQLLIVAGMTRAAVTKKALAGKLDGDKIKDEIAESDEDWDKFIQYLNETPAGLKNPGDATTKARDKTSYLKPSDQADG
ncbi:MAG: hypothetical protein KME43_25380 [Myxacorys chilensis ATA2-1-KO14]|jgi:hypothetical protein|nr:hypothetical protein [Myxacorys chilensis ATA2-1-KO14]